MKLTHTCKSCNKPVRSIIGEFPMGSLIMYAWDCGHTELREKLNLNSLQESQTLAEPNGNLIPLKAEGTESSETPVKTLDTSYYSLDSEKCAYDFQISGVEFVENSGFNALIADSMGLGKTIQALITLKRNKVHLCPTLIIVKSTIIFQWAKELKIWASNHPFGVMPILNRDQIIPGFGAYIISRDLLGRRGVLEKLLTLNLKSIIIDECHAFKDPSATRTKALIKLITLGHIKYKIALSGTPIKNRADEYFTILNLLAPEYFSSLDRFKRRWLIPNEKGVYTRINPYYINDFHDLTSRWIIRREKSEVLKNLPPLTRDYQLVEIEDETIKNTYNSQVNLFNNFLNSGEKIDAVSLLGWLAKFRAITGQAKAQAGLDFVAEHLDSTDESIAVGIQHHSVRDTLYYVLDAAGYSVLKLSGEDNAYAKDRIVTRFNNGESRVLVINMIAGGEGLNLQSCANALILERQWNSADEEQFEGRFHRNGQVNAVKCTYMIAAGTIDEFFHDMVLRKRQILGETLSRDWTFTDDASSIKELTEKVRYSKI